MKKKFLALVLTMAMACALAACGGSPKEETAPANQETKESEEEKAPQEEEKAPSEEGADLSNLVIGYSEYATYNDWRVAHANNIQDAIKEAGWTCIFDDAQDDQENQIKALRNFISQDVDVIVISPATATGWDTVLQEVYDAGIPVIVTDRTINVSNEDFVDSYILPQAHEEAANELCTWLGEYMTSLERGEDELNVAILQGTIGGDSEIARTNAIHNWCDANPNYKIVLEQTGNYTRAEGQEVMESFLKSGTKIDILYSENDDMSLGAIEAIKAAGLKPGEDIVIISFDGTKAGFEAMVEGHINCIKECTPFVDDHLADTITAIMNGEEVEKVIYMSDGLFPQETAAENVDSRVY
ncbi:MAG: substrate-binding domain-containing protein [Lachnospiraceae bacterium]|nr:substrate-binding domain-containing protein [Lachnospiraceae bacterium]